MSEPIVIAKAQVVGTKADFVKRVVKLTLQFGLDDDALDMREELSELALDMTRVEVRLKPLARQSQMLDRNIQLSERDLAARDDRTTLTVVPGEFASNSKG